MTPAVSMSASTRQRFVQPPTSGLDDNALLVNRPHYPAEWGQRIDELLDIRRMEDDWDGLGAPAPATALVDSAFMLAQILRELQVPPPARVVAGLAGTVLFEWQGADGAYFEVEVTRPQHADWIRIVPGQQTTSGDFGW